MNLPVNPPFVAETTYRRYLDGLLTNNRQQCRECFEEWLASVPELRSIYDDLVRRSLYAVGELWEQGKISVATEHMSTAISESLLNLTYPRLFAQPRNGRSAVVTCVSSEHHQIGGRMVADIFELNGWRSHFLGANTPLADVISFIGEKRPDAVALSLAIALNVNRLLTTVAEIRKAYPQLPILTGGQSFHWLKREQVETLPGVRVLKTLGELEAWINNEAERKNV